VAVDSGVSMDRDTAVRAVLGRLGDSPPEQEVAWLVGKAVTISYWKELNPSLTIGEGRIPDVIETEAIGAQAIDRLSSRLAIEGYFQSRPILWSSLISRMARSIEVLRQEGWPPVLAFVYDEFWYVTRGPSVVRLLTAVLGEGYRQIPHVWCHYVDRGTTPVGWVPHIDGGSHASSRSGRLSIWLPLLDASLENGCIYLMPKDRVSEGAVEKLTYSTILDVTDCRRLLQASRAVPARAGEVLGWGFDLLHWGSHCSAEARNPRVSLALEFIDGQTQPRDNELPLLDAKDSLPHFRQRLNAISNGILGYHKFEPVVAKYHRIARRIIEQTSSPD
jgi:hypothetical protein